MSEKISGAAADGEATRPVALRLLPYTITVFLGFLAIGLPLPVLSLQVHERLGFGPFVVGVVLGIQSVATLCTRGFAGRCCDVRGVKPTSLAGLLIAAAAGVVYLLSSWRGLSPAVGLAVLIGGRMLLGLGESLFITALASWQIGVVGPRHTGQVMAWQGVAMYGALAVGASLGGPVDALGGFALVAVSIVVLPVLGALYAWILPAAAAIAAGARLSFVRVLGAIWLPGVALALASAGFGTLAAFIPLRFQAAGWSNPGLALTAFGAAYILVRLFFAGLPDRLGPIVVAVPCLLIEASGQILVWAAPSPALAIAGGALTGLGYSLVFPALGVEAMRRVTAENRGSAVAAFLACFDLGLGAAGPLAGILAGHFGLSSTFLAAAAAALVSVFLTLATRRSRPRGAAG